MTIVAIMAGGRGQRLHPLTEHTPKPMLRAGLKPILQQVIEQFRDQGFGTITLCVGYRHQQIEDYFGDGGEFGVSITYVREDEPLGTAGALRHVAHGDRTVIVQNGDVLVRCDYRELLREHETHQAVATVCVAVHQYQVPYGVLTVDAAFVTDMREKPIETWLVNAGIYVLSPSFLATIPEGRSDMPDLLARAPGFVRHYQLTDSWYDVGRFEDLARANGRPAA